MKCLETSSPAPRMAPSRELANQRKRAIRTALLSGETPKGFAIDHGISLNHAALLAKQAGFTRMYVTADEQQLLLRQRNVAA